MDQDEKDYKEAKKDYTSSKILIYGTIVAIFGLLGVIGYGYDVLLLIFEVWHILAFAGFLILVEIALVFSLHHTNKKYYKLTERFR